MGIVDVKVVTFFAKNSSGGITKIARENYLRDDICCGISSCPTCKGDNQIILGVDVHAVIPDAETLTAQIDLFIHPSVKDIILLQTVLDSIKRTSISTYNRLIQVVGDPEKRVFLFYNRFHYGTFCATESVKGDASKDALSIAKTCAWYKSHTGGVIEPVIISDNVGTKECSLRNNLKCMTVLEYVEIVPSNDNLADMVAMTDYKSIVDERTYKYPDHLTISQIMAGLKSGALYSGKLDVESHNIFEGTVICKIANEDQNVSIIGRENMNRGMDGDIVAISLISEDECKLEKMEISDDESSDYNSAEGVLKNYGNEKKVLLGKIVGIVKRAWGMYCGNLDAEYIASSVRMDDSKIQAVYFWPYNKKLPRIRIGTRQVSRLVDKRIAVSIDSWPKDSRYPIGHYIKTMGEIGDKKIETDVVIMENNIIDTPFAPRVLANLPSESDNWKVEPYHFTNRTDFTGVTAFSIDPPGCTDIDDVLHCRKLQNGNFEVGVHIADVTFFIKPDTYVDLEARNRSTAVYLVDKRIDMIPQILGTNLCSLKSDVNRLCVSCIVELDNDANVVNRYFCRSVIKSKASMTYHQAQSIISGGKDASTDSEISRSLLDLYHLAKKLRAKRREAGALSLASPEMRFELGENLDVHDIKLKHSVAANFLVEEFMLLANVEVAKKIYSSFKRYSLLRRHPEPSRVKFEGLIKAVSKLGHTLVVDTSKTLADSLDKIAEKVDPYIDYIIRMQVTRCMTQASYFSSGTLKESEFCHYGLATPIYTHFTSPIRRYPDIIVHRILLASMGIGDIDPVVDLSQEALSEICDISNKKHYQAQVAARASASLYSSRFLSGSETVSEGYVLRVTRGYFNVIVRKYGIEGIIKPTATESSQLSDVVFDTENQTVTASNGTVIKVYDKVKVRLVSETTDSKSSRKGRIRMYLVEPKIELFSYN